MRAHVASFTLGFAFLAACGGGGASGDFGDPDAADDASDASLEVSADDAADDTTDASALDATSDASALDATSDASAVDDADASDDVTMADADLDAADAIDAAPDVDELGVDAADDAASDADATTIDAIVAPPTWPYQCMYCHGDTNPAPPFGVGGQTATTDRHVGAHQSHLGTSTWHHEIACGECHVVPTKFTIDPAVPTHRNGTNDLSWGPIAKQGAYDSTTAACTNAYCHGATLRADASGLASNRTPTWTLVDGSQAACGTSCHTLPPGGGHPASTACPTCHGAVVSSFTPGSPPTIVWKDASLHVDGKVDVSATSFTCTTCHGEAARGPAPPLGTKGETSTSEPAVGAHQAHLAGNGWSRDVQCTDCHALPASTLHANGVTDFAWGGVSTSSGAAPSYDGASATCSGVYCHGATLAGPNAGGVVRRAPTWNVVDGTFDACGTSCHTNPPGGAHPQATSCPKCHGAVIASWDPTTPSASWTDRKLHVDGVVEVVPMTCTTCHGQGPSQVNPPVGVAGETATNTMAVGRHVAHLTASATHAAFACDTCHVVPAAGDTSHTLQYVASASLATAGHHGDVTFSHGGVGAVFDPNASQGIGPTARGTCVGGCHSNGRGGPPIVTPYWAGGAWNAGSCGSCHAATMNGLSERHPTHSGESLACTACHPSATSSTHMNGAHDVNATISGAPGSGSVTTIPPGAPGNPCGPGVWACSGTCHGKGHSPRCWR